MNKTLPVMFTTTMLLILNSTGVSADVNLPWSTTYDCAEWTQGESLSCDGISPRGNWFCGASGKTTITVAANMAVGGGGRGARFLAGDGININSGTLDVGFNTPQTEVWVRWYMRYEEGFQWSGLNYDKWIYFNSGETGAVVPEFEGSNGIRVWVNGGTSTQSSGGWTTIMGESTSDGLWHLYEVHLKLDTDGTDGVGQIWIDGDLVLSSTTMDFARAGGWTRFHFYSNQRTPANGRCMAVDFDDMAVSNTGYIGPITTGDTTPPVRSNGQPTGTLPSGTTQTTTSLTTNEQATCKYSTTSGTSYASMPNTFSTTGGTTHSTLVFGLSDGNTYNYYVRCNDTSGNYNTNDYTISFGVASAGDITPPTVSITSPTQGQSVSGIISVSATASDNVGVAGVQFKLDGANLGTEDTASPYLISWDTTAVADGSHTLTATARDTSANTATSSPVSVTVNNGAPQQTIFFQELFEDTNFASRGWYDITGGILSTTEHIPGSTSSLECNFLLGGTGCNGGVPKRHLFTESDEVYVSYWVKYSSNWEGSNKPYHPHLFHTLTNEDSDYSGLAYTYLTTYIEDNEGEPLLGIQDGKNIDESNIGVDLTGVTEDRSIAGCNGDSDGYGNGQCYLSGSVHWNGKEWRAGSVYFQDTSGPYYKNDWHFIEAYIKLNSISGGIGIADGVMKYWYDGNLIIDHSDVMIRTGQHPTMKFNQFIIAPYIGDGSPVDQTFWVDDLTVADYKVSAQCEQDNDCDGYGIGPSCLGPDCNDNNPNLHTNITCPWDGSQCNSFSLCLLTCPTPPQEVCTNSLDDDCDSLTDCKDSDCFQNPACQTQQQELFIFQDSLPSGSNIGSSDPMTVSTNNPYQGTANLEITGQGTWSNCRIENLNLDMTSVDWQNSYLEFAINSPISLGYVAVNLWGDGNKASEQVISLTGPGNYETIQINMTDFSPTQSGFGNSLTQFMIGSGWGSSTIYLDEVKIVSPGSYHRADNNPQDGCITIGELLSFIDRWKLSSTDVPMPKLMESIGLWKQGTGCSQ